MAKGFQKGFLRKFKKYLLESDIRKFGREKLRQVQKDTINPQDVLEFHYNPTNIMETKNVVYSNAAKGKGHSSPDFQYTMTKPREISFELFFNEIGNNTPVTEILKDPKGGNFNAEFDSIEGLPDRDLIRLRDPRSGNTFVSEGANKGRKTVRDSLLILKSFMYPDVNLDRPPWIEFANFGGEVFFIGIIKTVRTKTIRWHRVTKAPLQSWVKIKMEEDIPSDFPLQQGFYQKNNDDSGTSYLRLLKLLNLSSKIDFSSINGR